MSKNFFKCIALSNIDTLIIGACNSNNYIEKIIDTFVKIKLSSVKVVEGHNNDFIYITGHKIIKLHYITNDSDGIVKSTTFLEPFTTHVSIDNYIDKPYVCDYYAKLLSKDYKILCDDSLFFSTFFEIYIKFNEEDYSEEIYSEDDSYDELDYES